MNTNPWILKASPSYNSSTSVLSLFYKLNILRLNVLLISQFRSTSSFLWAKLLGLQVKQVGWSNLNLFPRYKRRAAKLQIPSRTTAVKSGTRSMPVRQKSSQLWMYFLQYWSQARPKTNDIYFIHREFRVMFMSGASPENNYPILCAKRLYNRWVESVNLLTSLFFANSKVQMLSSKTFIEEALIFNWHHSYKNYKLFKYSQAFVTFNDAKHGGYIHRAIKLLFKQRADWFLIVDLDSHRNLLTYLQKASVYLVGLTPVNYSPWLVSYPIPAFSDSKLTQYYFLKWIFLLKSKSTVNWYYELLSSTSNL